MAARGKKLRVQLDDRTEKLTDGMLECRGDAHDWRRMPPNPARFAEMAKAGYKEVVKRCVGGCGTTLTRVYDRRNGGIIEEHRDYDPDYKMPKGSGRMSKADARVALWVREDAQLYV